MLVLRELHHVSWEVTELKVREAVVSEVFQQPAASRRHDIRTAVARPRRGEQLATGIEETGGTARVSVLGLGSRRRRNVTAAAICESTWIYRTTKMLSVQRKSACSAK